MGRKTIHSHRRVIARPAARPVVGHMPAGRPQTERVWRFLRTYMAASAGRSPTAREIATGSGWAVGTVHQALDELEDCGLIRRQRFGTARGIQIVGARYLLPDDEAADDATRGL